MTFAQRRNRLTTHFSGGILSLSDVYLYTKSVVNGGCVSYTW